MMQIGIISDEIGRAPITQVRLLKQLQGEGIKAGVEIRSLGGKYPHQLPFTDAKKAAKLFRDADIPVHAIAGGLGKCDFNNKTEVGEHLNTIKRLGTISDFFGTNIIRMFLGFRWQDSRSMCKTVEEFCKNVLAKLPSDKILAIECEAATNAAMVEWIAEMIRRLGDERMKILFDPGNYLYAVETMMALSALGENLNDLIEAHVRAYHDNFALVHLKNLTRQEDALRPDTVDLDKGEIDIPNLLRVLKEVGYDGPVDLESHRRKEGQQISEAARLKPGGKGYGNPAIAEKDLRMLNQWISQSEGGGIVAL